MSTIVCQSMVSSSFESQLAEATTLKLKVAAAAAVSPPAAFDVFKKPGTDMDRSQKLEFGNWGVLQTVPKETGEYFRDNNYTNPWAKKTHFSTLSAKSLELCTENLGSETGSDIVSDGLGNDIFSFSSSLPPPPPPVVEHSSFHDMTQIDTDCRRRSHPRKTHNRREAKSFPPPLTTMTGASSLQVLRHREGGRLIIEAVEAPFRNAYLQAERSDGRLRLSYMTAESTTSGEDEFGDENATEVEEEEEGQIEEAGSEVGSESDGEINSNLEKEVEIHQWLRRCKEEGGRGNKGLCTNWKPALWVAIS